MAKIARPARARSRRALRRAAGAERPAAQVEAPDINENIVTALPHPRGTTFIDGQRGECGVCAIDVVAVDGEIDHRDVFFSDQQKHDNRKICPCVSRAIGIVTIDTLYRPEAAHR